MQFDAPISVSNRVFPIVTVTAADIAQAHQIRASRDRLYGNIFTEKATDQRWVGDLGEMCFDFWLTHMHVTHGWLRADRGAAGAADFRITDQLIGVKTVKRRVPIRVGYTAQITEQHGTEPVNQFFFLSYELPRARMWLLGGCTRQFFLEHSVLHQEGSSVHPNYQIRDGHSIRNMNIWDLDQPNDWLLKLAST